MKALLTIALVLVAGALAHRGRNDECMPVTAAESSGVEGQVSLRPVRSIERKGTPNARPYQARITVLGAGGREVAVIDTDADGRFRIELAPGTYLLRPESPGLYPRASEQRVTVRAHRLTRVEIVYDSGLR